MDTSLNRALTKLAKDELITIRDGQGKGIAVFHGRAWVTQDGDLRDVMLEAGESFAIDHPGLTIVQALEDTSVLAFDARPDETTEPARISSYQLHRQAARMRSDAIAEAVRSLAHAVRSLWAHRTARA
jgi:Protein of unknown function (DUF2917)